MSDALQVHDASAEALMGEIVDAFLERLGRGERPDVEEYAGRYPQLAAVLRQMLPALQAVHLSGPGRSRAAEHAAAAAEPEGPLSDFRIVREVGRGGMGVVYEAVQVSLGRRVALKVLPFAAALDGKQLQRFKNEAQAAACLHHPHIVPVYGVGCERGVHYYAMQFIDGHTLAALIQEMRQRAGLEEGGSRFEDRGSRFEDRGSQDQEGHSTAEAAATPTEPPTLDPRPSTLDPRSSILDARSPFFRTVAQLGVQAAEALEHAHNLGVVHRDVKPANMLVDGQGNLWVTDFGLARVQTDARLTQTGDLVGTLRYMSPEQALGRAAGVDHRADLYALGATLYELLTLEPAFPGRDRQELLRRIAFDEPRPPRRVNRRVPEELETIVLKAMAKAPEERYATAQGLADDLRRYLGDEPIRARRPSRLERARKWARRHRPVVWSAAAALLVTLAGLAGSVGWVVRDQAARQARTVTLVLAALDEAQGFQRQGKWREAQAAAKRAEALLANGGGGAELQQRVGDLLADLRMVERLEELRLLQANVKDGRFDDEGADRAYAAAFRDYGIDVDALDPRQAVEHLKARPIRVELAAALDGWSRTRQWFPRQGGKHSGDLMALSIAADSDPRRTKLRLLILGGHRPDLLKWATSDEIRAVPPVTAVRLAESLREMGALPEAVVLLRQTQEHYPGDFWVNHQLGFYLTVSSPPQWDDAIRFYSAAVALRPESAGARLNFGNALAGRGRFDEALAAFRRAMELKLDYAEAHCNLGKMLRDLGRQDEGVAALRRAIELKPELAVAHANLGFALWKQGRLDEAEAALRRAIALKPDRPDSALAHFHLGSVLADQGRLNEALAAFRMAIALKHDLPETPFELGRVLGTLGRFDEAELAYRRAVALKPDHAEAYCNLGCVLGRKGRRDEELAAYRRAIALKPDLTLAHFNLGLVLTNCGRLSEAVTALRKAIDLNADYPMGHYDLGNAFWKQGRLDEAVAAYRRAVALKPDYAEAYCNLGGALRQQGEFAQALAAYRQGHELGSRRPDWAYPSDRWVKQCQRLVALGGRQEAILRREAQPANAAERTEFAQLCSCKSCYLASARWWAEAFVADPNLADDLPAGYRNEAAYAAARAAAGQGDAGQLGDGERARWRKLALAWLRADLTAQARLLQGRKPEDCDRVGHQMCCWQGDPDLAGLRDPDVLPTDEQEACQQFWTDVEALRLRAHAVGQSARPPSPGK
jgi:serine/threonine protein kinase/Flp pilus assembly protein TadD